jgi:hypothetical protein
MVRIVPAERQHAFVIAQDMRRIDRRECAAWGRSPLAALEEALSTSREAWAVLAPIGTPLALYGVTTGSAMLGIGHPWLLATEAGSRVSPRIWLVEGAGHLAAMSKPFSRLENWAHRDNDAALRWLKRLGFVLADEIVEIGGEPMRKFWMDL